ncbi:hypothetical protein [Luteolibacter marinus]|uniref:hypothetical protein n=1 Tax=Luteolibacter marinus TaxID=2776705 RepID=UPI0018691CCE|nr:hypothetical protein [Luteolibacter marinus]
MKRFLLLALIGSLHAAPAERVKEIRGWYQTIQEATAKKERTIKFEDEPLSGTLTVREFDSGFAAVTLSFGAEHGEGDDHYYFKDGELFFVFSVHTLWQFAPRPGDDGTNPTTVDTRSETRLYYEDGKCIRKLTKSASSEDRDSLPAKVGKMESTEEALKESDEVHAKRGALLLKATDAGEVLKAFGN